LLFVYIKWLIAASTIVAGMVVVVEMYKKGQDVKWGKTSCMSDKKETKNFKVFSQIEKFLQRTQRTETRKLKKSEVEKNRSSMRQ
jgi:hypothetical protein